MSSLHFLTAELAALSKEAGRKHSEVKEASDKALALLKSSPESALSDLHDAQPPPAASPGAASTYPTLLAPIVLGCGTKNSKLTSIAVSGLQRLTGVRGAITKATVPLILSTLRTVLSQGVEIQLKILQTLVSLLTNCKDIHGETLAETLLISFKLQESKIGVVSSTAAATLRQLVMFVFEGVDEEDRKLGRPANNNQAASERSGVPDDDRPSAKDAYLAFEDICLLVNGDSPSFLKLQSLPRTFGLELIESVLSDFSSVFLRHSSLLHLLRSLLSPLLIRALAERPTFSTTLRLMRVMYLLLKKFNDELRTESEIFLTMFIKIVAPGDIEGSGGHPLSSSNIISSGGNDSKDALRSSQGPGGRSNTAGTSGSGTGGGVGNSPPWMRVLALEILRGICGDFDLLRKIWDRYDACNTSGIEENYPSEAATSSSEETPQHRVPVFTSMITSFNRLATEKPALLGTGTAVVSGVPTDPGAAGGEYLGSGVVDGLVGMAQQAANSVGVTGANVGGLAVHNASVKLQCIDQLDKADAPPIPETYLFLLALQCLNAIADGFASFTLPIYTNIMDARSTNQDTKPPALDISSDSVPPDLQISSGIYSSLRSARGMADAGWPALLASLSFFLTTNLDDTLFTDTLSSYQNITTTCGVLGLKTPRDAFLISLCKFAVPPAIISHLANLEGSGSSSNNVLGGSSNSHGGSGKQSQPASMLAAGADALGLTAALGGGASIQMTLSSRNLLCLRSLVGVSQALAGSLEKTWFYVFEALQNADYVVRADTSRRQKKRSGGPISSPALSGPSGSPSKSGGLGSAVFSQSASGNSASGGGQHNPLARFVPTDADEQAASHRAARLFEVSKALNDEAFKWFVGALCRLNGEMIGIPTTAEGVLDTSIQDNSARHSALLSPTSPIEERADSGDYLPEKESRKVRRSGINVIRTLRPGERSYAISKLGEVSVMNMQRLIYRPSVIGWDIVISHLLVIQHWQAAPSNVRLQSAEIFDKIVSTAPRSVINEPEDLQKRVQTQVLQALAHQGEPQGRSSASTDVDIRRAALDTLFKILESQGHALVCGWTDIFNILRSACPAKVDHTDIQPQQHGSSLATAKTSLLVRVAFPSLQLICSDFLAALSEPELELCITTLTEFGKQTDEVNVALTAGGLLWQVSDHLQSQHLLLTRASETESDNKHTSASESSLDNDVQAAFPTSSSAYLELWMFLLQRLLEICSDKRQEARDGAIQILWRSIELYGHSLDLQAWEICLWKVIFPLFRLLDEGIEASDSTASDPVAIAAAKPSSSKQWDESKILAITSAGTVFADHLPTKLASLSSFEQACSDIVTYARDSFLHGRPPVGTAAMKCLERISSVKWSKKEGEMQEPEQAHFVAAEVWKAWAEIGQQVVDHAKYDLTQQNLESYTKVAATLQRGHHLTFDTESCKRLLPILKGVITYPYSPDYRPDQDVLPPVQASVMEVLTQVDLSSTEIASAVLQDLSEYMTLAYIIVSDPSRSPMVSEGPRKQNQKITYVALSKISTVKLVETFTRFQEEPAIYHQAVESIFAAYSLPLKLKYDCPPPSKFGDDQPLWKTATLHFLQLARACTMSLESIGDQLDSETVSRIWSRIVDGFKAILLADCRPALGMSLDAQRFEEDFDSAVIATIEMHILPKLGNEAVPDHAIVTLARALQDASRLYDIPYDGQTTSSLMSPSLTYESSIDSNSWRGLRPYDSIDMQGSASALGFYGSTIEDVEVPRERFAYWCFDLLFLMCSRHDASAGSSFAQKRVAVLTLSLLHKRMVVILESYLADAELRGLIPFSRIREDEVAYVLAKAARLELDTGVFAASLEEDACRALKDLQSQDLTAALADKSGSASFGQILGSITRRSSRAHLFDIYSQLLSLLAIPSTSGPSGVPSLPFRDCAVVTNGKKHDNLTELSQDSQSHGQAAKAELSISQLAKRCLDIVGQELNSDR